MRVLLVEDEDALAETLAAGLRADGFAVDIARDGVQALTRIHGTQYDAMVLDIDGRTVATARFSQHRAANGRGAWIVSDRPLRLFSTTTTPIPRRS